MVRIVLFLGAATLILLAGICWPVPAHGQDDAAAPKAAAKADSRKDSPPVPPAAKDAPKKEVSPYLFEPKTPDELLESILQMVELARPNLARNYLDKLLESELNDEALLQLRDKYGPAPFVRLLTVPELRPPIVSLVDRITKLTQQRMQNASYINGLIDKLKVRGEEQHQAAAELEGSGAVVVPYLLRVIQNPDRTAEHDTILQILARMGSATVPVLTAALDAPDARFRAHVATILGYSNSERAIPSLWYPAFSESEPLPVRVAARLSLARLLKVRPTELETLSASAVSGRLAKIARDYYRQDIRLPAEDDGKVTYWQWSTPRSLVVSSRMSPADASELFGLRLARYALNLTPEVRDVQVLFLALLLSRDLHGLAWDQPYRTGPGTAHDLALATGSEVVGEVVQLSLQSGRPLTAVAALKVLEQIGTAEQLKGNAAKNTPFLNALNYPDLRVQFAAASAILQVDPTSHFLGAARVVDVLRRAISSEPQPRAIIARSNPEEAAATGGMFGQLGYSPTVVTTGRECFRAAAERNDVQLIVLHPNIVEWPLQQTIANLRADSRTATIPIVIYGTPNMLKDLQIPSMLHMEGKGAFEAKGDISARVKAVADAYPLTTYVLQSTTREQVEQQLGPFLKQLRTDPLTQPQRARMKAQAIGWLAHIATGRRQKVFNLSGLEEPLMAAVFDPKLAGDALQALGEIPSAAAQKTLADVILNTSLDSALREMAATKLAFHIQRFGLLIDSERIAKLQSFPTVDEMPGIQSALATLSGTLKPNTRRIGERLRAYDTNLAPLPR